MKNPFKNTNLVDYIKKQNKEKHKMTKDMKNGQLKQHRNEIKRLRKQISKHRLLMRQVRLEYKISKK